MRRLTTALDVLGLALVVAGVSLWSLAASLIVAGVAVLLVSWRVAS